MIARIIPVETSFDSYGLTYFVPDSVTPHVGELFEIPLGDEISYGIFAGEAGDYRWNTELKSIVKSTEIVPLDESSVAAISVLAHRHAIHIHKVLALFLPKWVLRRLVKYGAQVSMVKKETKKAELRFVSDPNGLMDELSTLCGNHKTAFVFPTETLAKSFVCHLGEEKVSATVFSDLTDAKREKTAIEAMEWKYSILVWTRKLCTYNLAQFDRLVYVEDSIMKELLHSFHQYSCLEILLERSKHGAWEIFFVSTIPSIELMSNALSGQCLLKNV